VWRPVIVMPVRRPLGMHMIRAAVIVDADDDMIVGQAVREVRILGEGEGGRRREHANRVQQGKRDCRPDAKALGRYGQHRASEYPVQAILAQSEDRPSIAVCNVFLLERDDVSSNRHPALAFWWRMIFSENRYPLFGIML